LGITRSLFYTLPPSIRFLVRRLYYLPSDIATYNYRKKNTLPPKGMIYTGGGDFEAMGNHIVNMLVTKHQLQVHHFVLDIGSGIGRVAIPLGKVINAKGKYIGIDVIEQGVKWCVKNITSRYPNFTFIYTPLKNDLYRNTGQDAATFTFPFENNSFDFAIANSLFTHMMPNEVQQYYKELHRVLKPGGKIYATFFIGNNINRYTSNPFFSFKVIKENYRLMDEQVTGANIAFDESYLFSDIISPKHFDLSYKSYGFWSNESLKSECEEFQDIVVMVKK
jgi:SAM-dependent methyltransferase